MLLPDPARSYAVLVGTSHYPEAGDLADLPAVRKNLQELRSVLTAASLGGLHPSRCEVVYDPAHERTVVDSLHRAATAATDTLILYYAGHGLVDWRNRLHLGLMRSSQDPVVADTLPFEKVRELLEHTRAPRRLVILDCCYSGSAFESAMSAAQDVANRAVVAGTYTLTSCAPTEASLAPPGQLFTAFTGHLLDLVNNGVPHGPELLDMQTIYTHLSTRLVEAGLPRPQQRSRNDAGRIALVRNAAYIPTSDPSCPTHRDPPADRHRRASGSTRSGAVGDGQKRPQARAAGNAATPTQTSPRRRGDPRALYRPLGLLAGAIVIAVFGCSMIVQGLTGVDDPDDRTGTTNVDDDPASDADEPTRLGSHEGPVEAMALSSDGTRLATGGWDDTVRIWDLAAPGELVSFDHGASVRGVALSPDGELVAAAAGDVRIWSTSTRQEVGRIDTYGATAVAFSPDGRLLAGGDGGVRLWDVSSLQVVGEIDNYYTGPELHLEFSPNGQIVVTADLEGPQVWDAATHELIAELDHRGVISIAISPDNRLLASGAQNSVRLWDLTSRQQVGELPIDTFVDAVSFSPDSRLVAAASDRGLHLWNPSTGNVNHLTHANLLTAESSPDGRSIFTSTSDGAILSVKVPDQQP